MIALRGLAGLGLLLSCGTAWAQHAGHAPEPTEQHEEQEAKRRLYPTEMALMAGMTPRDPMAGMQMPGWAWMVTGVARLALNDQGGPSGERDVESSNWNMLMGHHDLGSGRLTLMLMNSLEPATFEDDGSPELFQTGEAFEGRPLVDHQHAHDFIMNLSATWRAPLGKRSAAWAQLAPVGEPALGPTAFMHRASSGENPTAPLGHHWQDSTHITYNVITLGGGWGPLALEGSVFHGEEPDEDRWNIDGGDLDSFSGRLTLRLRGGFSAQLSRGHLEDPEELVPGDLDRTTASIHYGATGERPLAATLVWGRNDEEHGVSNSFLIEGAYAITVVDQVFARVEYVEKDQELLATKQLGAEAEPVELASIRAFTAGYLRDFELWNVIRTGLGADLTAYRFPDALDESYGDSPISVHLFVRVRWIRGSRGHGEHAGHGT